MPLKRDKIVVTRTYLPLTPEEYPANLPMNSENEHDQRTPVFAYDAKNVLPRSSGYSSFFGQQKTIGNDPLPPRIDHVLPDCPVANIPQPLVGYRPRRLHHRVCHQR